MTALSTLLVVDDSDEDMEALKRAFRRLKFQGTVEHFHGCEEAWQTLKSERPRPGVVLLDLNLPGTDGRALLKRLKSDQTTRSIPVVVLTTSTNEADVVFCYQHGASGYQPKLMDLSAQEESLRALLDYWFGAVLLPRGHS